MSLPSSWVPGLGGPCSLPTEAASQWTSGAPPGDFITSSVQGLWVPSPPPPPRPPGCPQLTLLLLPGHRRPGRLPRSRPARSGAVLCLLTGPRRPGPVPLASGSTPPPLPPFRLTTRWWRFVPPGHLWPSTSLPGPLPSKPRSPPLLSRPRLSLPQPLPRPPLLSSQRVSSPLGLGPPHHPAAPMGGTRLASAAAGPGPAPASSEAPVLPPAHEPPSASSLPPRGLRAPEPTAQPPPAQRTPQPLRALTSWGPSPPPPCLRCTPLSVRLLSARCAPLGPPSPSAPRSPRAWPRLAWGGSR